MQLWRGTEWNPSPDRVYRLLPSHQWAIAESKKRIHILIRAISCHAGAKEEYAQATTVRNLRFNGMEDRFESIAEAHRKTFEWAFLEAENTEGTNLNECIFVDDKKEPTVIENAEDQDQADDDTQHSQQPQRSNFVRWIYSDSYLYWITGKPGSGKSTLMKFLHDDSRTRQNLIQWSGDSPLTISGFFFWNAGTVMQMSRLGLFQTLLFNAINSNLELVPILFDHRWRSYQLFGGDLRPWKMAELAQAFRTLVSDTSKRFFFFIDGLDEFDGDGAELVGFISETLSSSSNVKICVAKDLTSRDVHLYVTEKLRSNATFVELEKLRLDDAKHLVSEVTGKASGVFLWVHLVVKSLLEGLRDGDNIADLEDRLLLLPSDLEKLFSKILEGLKPRYFCQASWLFQLIRGAMEPLTLWSLSLAEEGFDKAMSAEVKPMPQDELSFRAETMRRRLNSRCKGLIEAPAFGSEGPDAKVQYLHRTVRDYLKRKDVWDHIVSGTGHSLDVDLTLCGSFIHGMKIATPRADILTFFWCSLKTCMQYVVRFQAGVNNVHVIPILEELENSGDIFFDSIVLRGGRTLLDAVIEQNSRWLPKSNMGRNLHWIETKPRQIEGGISGSRNFFDLTFGLHLHPYIQYRLDKGFPVDWRIYDYSLLYTAAVAKDIPMLRILFERGANPNLMECDFALLPTSWHRVLKSLRDKNMAMRLGEQADIVELFLENGADVEVRSYGKSVDAVIRSVFTQWNLSRTEILLSKFVAAKAAQKKKQKRKSRILGAIFKKYSD